jgi:hypothetical protein
MACYEHAPQEIELYDRRGYHLLFSHGTQMGTSRRTDVAPNANANKNKHKLGKYNLI